MTTTRLLYHLIFIVSGPPQRLSGLTRTLRPHLAAVLRGVRGEVVELGSGTDELHLLLLLRPTPSFDQQARLLKRAASRRLAAEIAGWRGWRPGYTGFTVSPSHLDTARREITAPHRHVVEAPLAPASVERPGRPLLPPGTVEEPTIGWST